MSKCASCKWKGKISKRWDIDEGYCKRLEEFLDWLDSEIKQACTHYEPDTLSEVQR